MKRKGYTVNDIALLAIVLTVGAIALSLGSTVTEGVAGTQCTTAGGTWGYYSTSDSVNPATSGNEGCCSAVNASETTDCNTWTVNYPLNISVYGMRGIYTMGQYLPTIAVVIAAAVVIGILLYSFKFKRGEGE